MRLILVQRARRVGCVSSTWASALRSGVLLELGGLGERESSRLEVVMQSAFQEKVSHIMAVRGLLEFGALYQGFVGA